MCDVKLETVTLSLIRDSYCCKAILDTFGPTLKGLSISMCESRVTLADLVSFANLEYLSIDGPLSVDFNETLPLDLKLERFLPKLKILDSLVCLGKHSHLFEGKATLTELDLSCCHIGTKVWSSCISFYF